MSATEETKSRSAAIKLNLENWREVVILVDKLVTWEQTWFAGVIAGIVSLKFLLIWFWDPTFLTFFAFSGLFITLTDFLGPRIINQVFTSKNWNDAKEKHFEQVCENLSSIVEYVELAMNKLREIREKQPVMHFFVTLSALFSLAWIGNQINNYFLVYLITLGLSLMPGLLKRGLIQKAAAQVTLKFAEVVKGKDHMKKAE